jgi:carbon storage regulator CsrA
MLVLSRKKGERILIGQNVVVEVLTGRGGQTRLGISAPADVPIRRAELLPLSDRPGAAPDRSPGPVEPLGGADRWPGVPGGNSAGHRRAQGSLRRGPTRLSVAEAAGLFSLLADPTRLRLLVAIRDRGEASAEALAAVAGPARPPVSSHLELLRAAGLVEPKRDGMEVSYRLHSPLVADLLDAVGPVCPGPGR